jgi:FkbM family methyltransferase
MHMSKYNVVSLARRFNWFLNKNVFFKKDIRRKLIDVEMYLDLVTPGISKTLAIHKSREDDMVQVMKEVIKPGMTIIDCGSNIGFYPLLEEKLLGDSGMVYAIEPDVRNYRLLVKNANINKKGMIKTFNIAVSNVTGQQKMFVAEQSNLNKLISSEDDNFPKRHVVDEIVDIETITMDQFCKQQKINVDFVRMDIEGFEVEVFQGMKDIFKNSKSGFMVFLELHPNAYTNERSFAKELEFLIDQGFYVKILISAGEPQPLKMKELGYSPKKIIPSDGFMRGYYDDIKNDDLVELTCIQPKSSRYVLLQKK